MALSDALLPEFDQEMANTRRTLERVPEDKLDWRPHEKSTTLGGLVEQLDARWPGMADRLLEPGPQLREHINVFVDGERERDLAAPLASGSVVHVIPAVAGG